MLFDDDFDGFDALGSGLDGVADDAKNEEGGFESFVHRGGFEEDCIEVGLGNGVGFLADSVLDDVQSNVE